MFLEKSLDIGQRISLLISLRSGSKVHSQATVRWVKDGCVGLQFGDPICLA